jgi:hypothetical protein
MSSKKTTTSNQTQNTASSTTPTVPSWIQTPTMNAALQIGGLQANGPGAYTPGISDLQRQAATAAGNLTLPGEYQQASGVLSGVPNVTNGGAVGNITAPGQVADVNGQSVLDNLSSYYNPFESSIINPVLQQYDYQAGQTRAAQAAQAAAGGAFGGSRYGIQEANTEQQLAMGRAQTQGGLLNQMYTQAAGMSEADTARRQAAALANQQAAEQAGQWSLTAAQANQQAQEQAAQRELAAEQANQGATLQKAGLLTGLGTAENQSNLANLSAQAGIGAQMTDLQNAIKQYPLQYQAQIESLLSGLNPSLYTGSSSTGYGQSQGTSTETSSPGLLDMLGTGIQAASLFAGGPASAAGGVANLFKPTTNTSGGGWYTP